MPQIEPVWELMKAAEDMVQALVDMYPEKFGHVDASAIGVAAIANKEKPEGKKDDAKIGGVREPEALWSKKIYCIQFHKATWEKYDEEHRQHMLYKLLERIPEEFNGKVMPEDLKDSYTLVKQYGPDYMAKPQLPNLLKQKQTFALTPAAKAKDEADTTVKLAIDDHKDVNVAEKK